MIVQTRREAIKSASAMRRCEAMGITLGIAIFSSRTSRKKTPARQVLFHTPACTFADADAPHREILVVRRGRLRLSVFGVLLFGAVEANSLERICLKAP